MATLAQPPITLHTPSHDQHTQDRPTHEHSQHIHNIDMDQPDQEPILSPPLQAPQASAAPAVAQSAVADSDMEGGEDTAGSVSPYPTWTQPTDNVVPTASVRVIDVLDSFDAPPPPPFAPLSPIPPPPPPPVMAHLGALDHAAHPPPPPPAPMARGAAEDSDEDDDDDDRSHVSYDRARSFYPFLDDTSVPDPEEVRILQSYVEQSATDDAYWQARTFFDPQDPDFVPGEHGKIEWLVKDFNGTKENPRKDLLLQSDTVRIGGHEWRIKLLPHGNMHTDRLSLYVENVTVQSLSPEEWPEDKLPLPVVGENKVMKRRAVAAQISIVVYNPDEPRVNEFKSDAHQFHQDSPDHGWTRFTSLPWYEIHRRSYAQRQPLLRNDTLAIKAFVRVIDDPTGCMWAAKEPKKLRESSSMTGLLPFPSFEDLALGPVLALWLHFRPFRQILYHLGSANLLRGSPDDDENISVLPVLQAVLYRMRSRRVAEHDSATSNLIGEYLEDAYDGKESHDIVQTMDDVLCEMSRRLQKVADKGVIHTAPAALEQLRKVFGYPEAQFSGARHTKRSIEGKLSMQEVADGLQKSLCQSELLTIELERQVFDTQKRCWKKLLNKIHLDDQITVNDVSYTLYGFATHEGHLRNGKYSSFFRLGGLGSLWYTYEQSYASCQTRMKAVLSKEGVSPPEAVEEPIATQDRPMSYDRLLGQADAIAYVVIYVRDDAAQNALSLSVKEPWDVPKWILDDYDPKPATSPQATDGSSSETPPYDDASRTAENEDLEMNDAATDGPNEDKTSDDENTEEPMELVTINYLSQPFYEGQIRDGDYHGTGHLIYLNGDEYRGSFVEGCREDQGTMMYQNGDEYTGSWKSDQHHGEGTYKEKRTGNVYTGHWEEGKKQGEGTTYWKMSEEESRMCRICYCGEADAAFYDCGHVVACSGCARRVEDCPVCRRRVRDVVKLYYLA